LKLWLGELGHPVLDEAGPLFQPKADVKTIFIIQPIIVISEREWDLLDAWIEQGGTLILAGDNYQSNTALDHFDFSLDYLSSPAASISPASPLPASPFLTSTIPIQTDTVLFTTMSDHVVLLSAASRPVLVSFEQKKGRVLLSSVPVLFSNIALKDDAVAEAVLNVIALAEKEGMVWFDEFHHGIQEAGIVGPGEWLRRTPGGHALLFSLGVIFFALLMQGRAFGRTIPLLHEIKRRGPLEHVTAIANLNRKAGHRAEVLQQYHQRLKRHLGHRYRLDPSLPDDQYVHQLTQFNSSIDGPALLHLLQRLSQKNTGEGELLKLASEAAQWIKD
jgi:hypothetical protein